MKFIYLSASLQHFFSRTWPFPEKSWLDTPNIVVGEISCLILLKGQWDKKMLRNIDPADTPVKSL